MSMKGSIALTLAAALTVGTFPTVVGAAAQSQGNGVISGKASDEAKKPSDFAVQLRDVGTSQIVATSPLDKQARFSFNSLALSQRYLVELVRVSNNQIVCTAGPYLLSTINIAKTDVNINCGHNPASDWLLIAGGAAATAIAFGVRSPKG
jgi:hypothetical protein